jgi:hypothetical protein
VSAYVASPAGTAGVFNNAAGGKILTGQNNGVEKFSVDGSGNVNALGRFTGSGAGLTGIQFSNLSGTLASSQFSGTYSNAVTLSNTSNVLYGNGSNLTGVVAGPGSPYYIQNGTSQQSSAAFNISGNGTANSLNSATTYQIGGSSVLNIGSAADHNLFLGVGAGAHNVAGSGVNNSFSGAVAGYSNTTGSYNTFSGSQAGYSNTTGSQNTFNGFVAGLSNTSGSSNAFYGTFAGFSNTTGAFNTFSGFRAGFSNTTGSSNTFSGYQAGYNDTTGSYNTFSGWRAGYSNTTGGSNTFSGLWAGYSNTTGWNNSFSGDSAGYSNTTGTENTFSGRLAGYSNTTGTENTFSGYSAGSYNTTGSNNTFSGAGAGYSNTTGNNNIYIGNPGPASGTESNTIRIGGDVGYGYQTAAYIVGMYGSTSLSGIAVYINSDGKLGTQTSSLRFKEQVRDMGDSSSALMKLRPVTFFYKPQYDDGSHLLQYGLIAEEVAKVYPDIVAYDNDGQPYTVKYQYLAPMLLNEVQKQYRRAEAEAKVIATQEQKIDELEQRLSRLESLIPQTVAQK